MDSEKQFVVLSEGREVLFDADIYNWTVNENDDVLVFFEEENKKKAVALFYKWTAVINLIEGVKWLT